MKRYPKLIERFLKETHFSKYPTDSELDNKITLLSYLFRGTYPLLKYVLKSKIKRYIKYKLLTFSYWRKLFYRFVFVVFLVSTGYVISMYIIRPVINSAIIHSDPIQTRILYRNDMKSFDQLIQDIGRWESGNNWQARRSGSQYIGYFQFGDAAFEACKTRGLDIDKYGRNRFLQNKSAQITWFCELMIINKAQLVDIINRWQMKKIRGVNATITESGILMGAHLVGAGACRQFFESNGRIVPVDGNNTPITKYIEEFSGYNVDEIIY